MLSLPGRNDSKDDTMDPARTSQGEEPNVGALGMGSVVNGVPWLRVRARLGALTLGWSSKAERERLYFPARGLSRCL